MHKSAYILTCKLSAFITLAAASLSAEQFSAPSAQSLPSTQTTEKNRVKRTSFQPFTGKVIKNRVRMRLLPNLDGNIVKELNQGHLLIVVDEADDYYAVEPSSDMKAYIFRTFVLDNIVEGTHVNVRLKPELESPVLAQLNTGDRVNGNIDRTNNKWLEISMPKQVRFYVSKEYIEKLGDRNLMAKLEKRLSEVNQLLNDTQSLSKTEITQPFEQINLDKIISNYKRIIQNYSDFPDQTARAKESLESLQTAYNNKKLAYLENNHQMSAELKSKNDRLSTELKAQQAQLQMLKQQLQQATVAANQIHQTPPYSGSAMPKKMEAWLPVEESIYAVWTQNHENASITAFYEEQMQNAYKVRGIVEAYTRPIKNKPGDYVLVNSNNIPMAFLYSTHINLQDWIGHEATLIAAPRPNNNFAFPAYYVLGVE